MCVVLLRTQHVLAVQRMLDAVFDQDRNGLVHLVANDTAYEVRRSDVSVFAASVISRLPFRSARFAHARCPLRLSSAGWCSAAVGWPFACAVLNWAFRSLPESSWFRPASVFAAKFGCFHPCSPLRPDLDAQEIRMAIGSLAARKAERLTRQLFAHAIHFVQHLARLNFQPRSIPDCPLPLPIRTSAGFFEIGLSGKIRIQMRPPTLDVTGHRTTCRLDLARGQTTTAHCLQAEFTERRTRRATGSAPPVLRPFCSLSSYASVATFLFSTLGASPRQSAATSASTLHRPRCCATRLATFTPSPATAFRTTRVMTTTVFLGLFHHEARRAAQVVVPCRPTP